MSSVAGDTSAGLTGFIRRALISVVAGGREAFGKCRVLTQTQLT